jgi:hypothetical protein
MSTADAVARETAWLKTTGDTLPSLLTADGGPFNSIHGYMPRTPARRETAIYVLRRSVTISRFAHIRRMPTHAFNLVCDWPMTNTTGDAQAAQQAFDNAIDLVLQRIGGLVGDKTHGGRFLAVAEGTSELHVEFAHVHDALYTAQISYTADDAEQIG